jgi:protein-disulfide isomerase
MNMLQVRVKKRWIIIAGIILVCAAVGAFVWQRSLPRPKPTGIIGEDGRAIGSVKAPVTIIEYGDFGCPTCRAWYRTAVMQQILLEYGDQVRFEWRDFPVITAQSPKAAEAGLCANDQGQFWNYYNTVYMNPPAIGVEDLKRYAADISLNQKKFNQCLDSGQHKAEVEQETKEGYNNGFIGTPSFLINGKPLVGPATFNQFKSLIDPLLPKRG